MDDVSVELPALLLQVELCEVVLNLWLFLGDVYLAPKIEDLEGVVVLLVVLNKDVVHLQLLLLRSETLEVFYLLL